MVTLASTKFGGVEMTANSCRAAFLLAVSVSYPAHAQAVRTIYTVPNAVLCDSPFDIKEAKTAAAAGDAKWLAKLGCAQVPRIPAIVIESSVSLGFFKVRVQSANGDGITAFGSLQDFVE
jgi:hypothetical protein